MKTGRSAQEHRTDSLPTAVNNLKDPDEFTVRYQGIAQSLQSNLVATPMSSSHSGSGGGEDDELIEL